MTSPDGLSIQKLQMSSTPTDSESPSSAASAYTKIEVDSDGMANLFGITVNSHSLFMHAGEHHWCIYNSTGETTNYIQNGWLNAFYGHLLRRRTLGS